MKSTTDTPSKSDPFCVLVTIRPERGTPTDPEKVAKHIEDMLKLSTPRVESCKLLPTDIEQQLRLEQVKINVLTHAFKFLMVGETKKRIARMPEISRTIVNRAVEIMNEQFPSCENTGPIAPRSAVETANAQRHDHA